MHDFSSDAHPIVEIILTIKDHIIPAQSTSIAGVATSGTSVTDSSSTDTSTTGPSTSTSTAKAAIASVGTQDWMLSFVIGLLGLWSL